MRIAKNNDPIKSKNEIKRDLWSAVTKKIIKQKRSGTLELWWADAVKLVFLGHFEGQKGKKRKTVLYFTFHYSTHLFESFH